MYERIIIAPRYREHKLLLLVGYGATSKPCIAFLREDFRLSSS